MYHQYFGLNEAPFSIAVNPRYLFMSARHRDALAHLLYGVGSSGGFILLTGEVGTGKTTINRCLLEQLPQDTDVAIILNPALNALELLASACDELGIEYDIKSPTLKTLTDKLQAFLLENHARGRSTVLMIDEAQHLDFDVLEQIRLLTNLETNNQKLLQIILIGQPELAQLLNRPELRQLNQRITARYNLEPLNLEESRAYIRHRLTVAGLAPGRDVFPDAVVRELYKQTRGIPRLINVLCDRILLGAYGQNKQLADMPMLRTAVREVLGEEAEPYERSAVLWRKALIAVVLLGLGLGLGVGVMTGIVPGKQWLTSGDTDNDFSTATRTVSPPASTSKALTQASFEPAAATTSTAIPEEQAQALPSNSGSRPLRNPAPVWLLPPAVAMSELWALSSVNSAPDVICSGETHHGLSCVMEHAQTWDVLEQYDRPLVLDMVTPERFSASVLLLGIQGRSALVLSESGPVSIELAELGPAWNGNYRFLWRPPDGFSSPLYAGLTSAAVEEVARLFARLDGQNQTLSGASFSPALKQRVILFQRQYGLEDDGVIGMKTLLKLNELLGVDVSNEQAIELLREKYTAAGQQ